MGDKVFGTGQEERSRGLFAKAWSLYSLFWGIKLGLVRVGEVSEITGEIKVNNKIDLQEKLDKTIKYLVDCCKYKSN